MVQCDVPLIVGSRALVLEELLRGKGSLDHKGGSEEGR